MGLNRAIVSDAKDRLFDWMMDNEDRMISDLLDDVQYGPGHGSDPEEDTEPTEDEVERLLGKLWSAAVDGMQHFNKIG